LREIKMAMADSAKADAGGPAFDWSDPLPRVA
jgi:hypothetical protein